MSDRAAKLRRLNAFRRALPHCSATALAAVLDEVERAGIPDGHSRHALGEATSLELSSETPYGILLDWLDLKAKGGDANVRLPIINPHAMMHKACSLNGSFCTMISERLSAAPPTPEAPWKLIMYSDEVVPGNALSHDNKRKVWVIYFSWIELGAEMLSREDAWICVFVARSSEVAKVSAGMGQVFGSVLKRFFGDGGHDMSTAGIVLPCSGGEPKRLWCKLGMILQDGGAHKSVWHCKGDAGTKLCMLCKNLYSEASELVDEDGDDLLTCTLVHEAELDFATDADIKGAVRRLAAHATTDPAAIFALRQQAVGFRHEPDSLLLDPELADVVHPASQFCHDWMHAVLVHGVFNTMVYLLLEALVKAGVRDIWDQMHAYVGFWTWPNRVTSSTLHDVFQKRRQSSSRKAKNFKCTASEGLSVYPIMAYFLQVVVLPAGRAETQCKAFLALADVLDLLSMVPLGLVSPFMLRQAVKSLLELCLAAGWRLFLHPKFHWLVHLPRHLEQFGCLPTCWVHERKHRMVKRYASDICNTTVYEKSILGQVTSHHLSALGAPSTFSTKIGLIEPTRAAPPRMRALIEHELQGFPGWECHTAKQARISKFETCSAKDVVLVKIPGETSYVAGQVWFHASYGGVAISLVSLWTLLHHHPDSGVCEWQEVDDPTFMPTDDIVAAVTYTRCRPGVVRTLVPCQFRPSM